MVLDSGHVKVSRMERALRKQSAILCICTEFGSFMNFVFILEVIIETSRDD